jgi:hypothetical protein
VRAQIWDVEAIRRYGSLTPHAEDVRVGGGVMSGLASVRDELHRLGPWHFDTGLFAPELKVDAEMLNGRPSLLGELERDRWMNWLTAVYPHGLGGRSILDAACNCGAYLFWMRDVGAGRCFGFDVREHWIKQARFLQRVRGDEDMRFEVSDLYDVPKLDPGEFDIGIFKGIFYHLPDPIHGLKLVADRTRELLVLNTGVRLELPDGMLAMHQEVKGMEDLMSGVHGLCWFPTGPKVLEAILAWLGFPAVRQTLWVERDKGARIELVAARDPARLESLADST